MRFNKFKNKRTEVDGHKFHSKKEAARYKELKILEEEGAIKNLVLQPSFWFYRGVYDVTEERVIWGSTDKMEAYKDELVFKYISDFRYVCGKKIIVEDVKGFKTPLYKLKAKIFQALFPEYVFLES